jgi:hypothetical protein
MTNMVLVGTGAVHPLYVLYLVPDTLSAAWARVSLVADRRV